MAMQIPNRLLEAAPRMLELLEEHLDNLISDQEEGYESGLYDAPETDDIRQLRAFIDDIKKDELPKPKENKLLIVIEGGLVQNVMANHQVTVVKIDYDNFGQGYAEEGEEEIDSVVGEMYVEQMETDNFADTISDKNLSEHEAEVKKWLQENMDSVTQNS